MTSGILKNLVTEKATRLYPFEERQPYDHARGELVNDVNKCNFCGICAAKCPSACITVDKKTATWECALFSCLFCGICVEACPKKSLAQKTDYRKPVLTAQVVSIQGTIKEKEAPDENESL
jgi:ech hydrogenase subunit F